MGKITMDLIVKITDALHKIVIIIKDTFNGGKKNDRNGSSETQ